MSNEMNIGVLIVRSALPAIAGMDALEARVVVVQEVPSKAELRFFAVHGEERTEMSQQAALAVLREHVPKLTRPVHEMSQIELWAEILFLRAEADRMRPVYEAAKAWRETIHRACAMDVPGDRSPVFGPHHALSAAIDAADKGSA